MIRSKFLLLLIGIIIMLGISCKKDNKNISDKNNKTYFTGDQKLADKSYFETLTAKEGYVILKKQNDLYEKNYSNFKSSGSLTSAYIRFEKQFLKDKKNYRIVLYTLMNDTKTDSIEFYRNTTGFKYEPSNYTHISYLDLKTNKIWQLKYFSSPADKSCNLISYQVSKIDNGKIKPDSLFYLDESLDAELEKRNLYY
jgi:hypothetical protein